MATATAQDPRMKLATWIEGTSERQRQPIAMRSGRTGSATDAMQVAVAAAASRFVAAIDDVRGSPNLSRSQQAVRIEEAGFRFGAALKEASSTLATEAQRVKVLSLTANYVADYSARTPAFHEVMADQTIAQRFANLDAGKRAAALAAAVNEPAQCLRTAEALLRQPREISGLTTDEWHQVRVGVLKVFDSATHAAINIQVDEVHQAQQALQHATALLRRDAPAALTELVATAPELAAAMTGTGDFS